MAGLQLPCHGTCTAEEEMMLCMGHPLLGLVATEGSAFLPCNS